jgi:hypothetical protein
MYYVSRALNHKIVSTRLFALKKENMVNTNGITSNKIQTQALLIDCIVMHTNYLRNEIVKIQTIKHA